MLDYEVCCLSVVGNVQAQAETSLPILWLNDWILVVLVAWLACLSVTLLSAVICIIILCCRQTNINGKSQTRRIKVKEPNNLTKSDNTTNQYPASGNDKLVHRREIATTSGNTTELQSNFLSRPEWHNTLREESFETYCIDTVIAPVAD